MWTIHEPYDTFLLKFWEDDHLNKLEHSLCGTFEPEIIDALFPNNASGIPNKSRKIEGIHDVFKEFRRKRNLCDKHRFCQDVGRHGIDFACVTIATIRLRLINYFPGKLGTLSNINFQSNVIKDAQFVINRKNYGVLIFDYQNDNYTLRNHVMKVLYDNFFLYTTPKIDTIELDKSYKESSENMIHSIIRQMARNTDCVILFVDELVAFRWNNQNGYFQKVIMDSLCWDLKVRIVIISLSPNSDQFAIELFKWFNYLKPIVVSYDQIKMAPSGGIISIISKSCQLNPGRAIVKYWYRAMEMSHVFNKKKKFKTEDDVKIKS